MLTKLPITTCLLPLAVALIVVSSAERTQAQGFQIGGPNGIVMGGGQGFRIGPPNAGVQFGGGQGARFGTRNAGVQFGGGQGARFGTRNAGLQFGNGEGVRVGTKSNPMIKIGGGSPTEAAPVNGSAGPMNPHQSNPVRPNRNNAQPKLEGPSRNSLNPAPTTRQRAPISARRMNLSAAVSVLEK